MRNPFHLVEFSPWPLTGSISALGLVVGMASWFHGYGFMVAYMGLLGIIITMIQWWRDVIREGSHQGYHTTSVVKGLRWGMILFIISEVCFFFAFFWAYFHSSLTPTTEVGSVWPPVGINPLNPFDVPLLNTVVLLCSGVSVTWAHHGLMEGLRQTSVLGLVVTVLLGFYFTLLQLGEYNETTFSLSDGIYGSAFFVATGFHGFHVIIGTTFLLVCLVRLWLYQYSSSHHFGFEAAAWYWHFVDVVWLFLYTFIYWWGS
uniref:Cytochrome c oxidase subunit 3 n=2 Tax=Pectinatella magnifica TaxID=350071 RepID=A0A344AUW7_9BILA|nr:cytochrome c oxidase subunit III [Pectinatella magnifica]AWX65964.1 cytochrome c oxidase subunit 3 [Pectinatella magnifica]